MKNKYYVDQEVFYKPNYQPGRKVIIDKIGNKWVYFKYANRFDIKTGYVDGGKYPSPGKIYLNEDEYKKELFLKENQDILWMRIESLKRKIGLDQINKINAILDEVYFGTTQK